MTTVLLTTTQAAEFLGMSLPTMERWRSEGKGPPFVRLGRSVRYRKADLERWVKDLPAHQSTAA